MVAGVAIDQQAIHITHTLKIEIGTALTVNTLKAGMRHMIDATNNMTQSPTHIELCRIPYLSCKVVGKSFVTVMS